jgi:hypothetical protein
VQIIDQTTSAAAHLFAVNMDAQEQHTRNISSLDRSSELAQAFLGLFSILREEHYLDQFCTNGAPPPGP